MPLLATELPSRDRERGEERSGACMPARERGYAGEGELLSRRKLFPSREGKIEREIKGEIRMEQEGRGEEREEEDLLARGNFSSR